MNTGYGICGSPRCNRLAHQAIGYRMGGARITVNAISPTSSTPRSNRFSATQFQGRIVSRNPLGG